MQLEKLGPYRLERQLGRGGMGAVYVGVNEETGERAAIKVLAPAFAAEPNFRGRFAAEIEALKKLRHPNIVQLYGFGEEAGNLFYAMQLVEGDNLEVELRRGRSFDWREAIDIALDVCKALKHAHDRGIIHRDLKPANLLRGEDGRILLSDFGIAKLFGGSEFTAAGGVIGTADYMSPEQAAGEGVTPRSDLYGLGAVMFTLLTGRPPFQGRSIPDIIHQVRYTDAPLVGRFAPTTPVELENIVARLLEKDPKKRIPTPLALSNLLQAMSHDMPQTVHDANPLGEPPERQADFVLATEAGGDISAVTDPSLATRPTSALDEKLAGRLTTGHEETAVHTAPPIPPQPAKAAPTGPPPAASSFTAVPEEELGKLDEPPDGDPDDDFAWAKLAGVVTALAAMALFLWYVTRPPTADQLFTNIQQIIDERDVLAAEEEIAAFLAQFSDDPRSAALEEYQREIELARLQRDLERRIRGSQPAEGMSLVHRTYLDAMQTARSDPHRAVEKLESLVAVFGGASGDDEETRNCVELSKQQLEQLRESLKDSLEADRAVVRQRLKAAEELYASDPEAARAIWRGIADLYGEDRWAEPYVAEARRKLDGDRALRERP